MIAYDPEADYLHRMIVPKKVWARLVAELATEQEWFKFKSEVENFLGSDHDDYSAVLHRVWATMRDLQLNEPVKLNREMLEGVRDCYRLRVIAGT